ncbi:MAG: glycosyltransferase [Patescibacteria group bacterium]
MQKVVIVMPVWNEASNLRKMVKQLLDVEFPIINAEMNLLVVDNHSTDDTVQVVEEYSKKDKRVKLIQQKNNGLGWAYVSGFQYAMKEFNADAVLEMDGDFQHPTRFIKPMVDTFLAGADYCIGSRYVKGGSIPKEWQFSRRAVSYLGNLFIRLVLLRPSLHDLTTGFRLSRVKGVLDQIDLPNLMELNRFAYKVDLLYQSIKLSKKTVEVPLKFAPRTMEKSKFNPKEMIATFKVAIILGIKDKMKIIKFGIVGFTGFVVNYITLRIFRNLGFTETLSWAFSTELAIINNYIFNNIWTFKEDEIKGIKQTILKFFQFNLTSAGALLIQSIAGPFGVKLVGVQYDALVLAFVVLFLVMPYNFAMYNLVIWRKKKV